MKNKYLIAGVLTTLISLSGCVATQFDPLATQEQNPALNNTTKVSFKQWLENDFTQEITRQIQNNPRIKGNPFLIVSFNDQEIRTEIDALTRYVRRVLSDQLLEQRGLEVIWNPTQQPWQHHRSLSELTCVNNNTPTVLLALDIQKSPFETDTLEIFLRALDLAENKWISGFGQHWKTTADATYMAGLKQVETDQSLKGLRPKPFEENEMDLMAAYLARNTSCLFKESYSEEPIVLYIDKTATNASQSLNKVFDMMDNYLNQLREVKITDSKARANVIMKQEVHHINGKLYQLWVKNYKVSDTSRLSGIETNAYVRLNPWDKQYLVSIADSSIQWGVVRFVDNGDGLKALFKLPGGQTFSRSLSQVQGHSSEWLIELPSEIGGTLVIEKNQLSMSESPYIVWNSYKGQKLLNLHRIW